METYLATGLFAWTLTLENGETRTVMAPSVGGAIFGILPSPVIKVERGDAIDPAAPPLSITLAPTEVALGAPDFRISILGEGFRRDDVIYWNGLPEPTTFDSPTALSTGVNMATASVEGPLPVTVRRVTGQESNAATFTFLPAEVPPEVPEVER